MKCIEIKQHDVQPMNRFSPLQNKPYWLWLGGVFTQDAMNKYAAVNPAANIWQQCLLEQLQKMGVRLRMVSHRYEPLWPKGALFPGKQDDLNQSYEPKLVRFFNAPAMRVRSLRKGYVQALRNLLCQCGIPECVLSYNVYDYHAYAAAYLQREFGVPWIPVVADFPGFGNDSWQAYRALAEEAAGHVFLSYAAKNSSPFSKNLHMEGGIDVARAKRTLESANNEDSSTRPILYAGSLGVYGGVDSLLEAFMRIEDPRAALWICGKGKEPQIPQAIRDRVTYYGLVSQQRLDELTHQAWVLVNPRPVNLAASEMNFPSKLLHYLSFCKPVVSTWTPGLGPDYANALIVAKDSPEDIANKLDSVLGWSHAKYREHCRHVREFIKLRSWEKQAIRLKSFIEVLLRSEGRK